MSPDGSRIAIAANDDVLITDTKKARTLFRLHENTSTVYVVEFSPDGKLILTAGWDHTATIWNAKTGVLLRKLVGHEDNVYCASFNADGTKVATGGWDEKTIIWDVKSGEIDTVIDGNHNIVKSVSFTPDSQYIATATSGNIGVWDTVNGKKIAEYNDYFLPVSATFIDNGSKLFIQYDETRTAIVDFQTLSEVMADARKLLAGHVLTEQEKKVFMLK